MTVENANEDTLFNDANAFIEDTNEVSNEQFDVSSIVGEGKKYRTTEDALRSVVHKETHIQKLERENRELRELTLKAKTTEELLKAIQNTKNGQTSDDNPADQFRSREDNNTPTRDTLLKDVLNVLEEQKAKEAQELNIRTVKNALITQYGAQYSQALNKLSIDLGLSQTEIDNMARRTPKAFLKLAGVELKEPTRNPVPTNSSMRPSNNENLSSDERGHKFYSNLRKTNPRLWESTKTQNEITNQALKLGQRYYEI